MPGLPLLPQTLPPRLLPQPVTPIDPSGVVDATGLDDEPLPGAPLSAPLPGVVYPWPMGDESGGDVRLARAGLPTGGMPGGVGIAELPDGRVPIGATALPELVLPGMPLIGDAPGDALLARPVCDTDWSLPVRFGWGLAVLLARERWFAPTDGEPDPPSFETAGSAPAGGGTRPYSNARGDGPRCEPPEGAWWGPGTPGRGVPVSST